jgi:hypothetical protein
MLNYLKKFTMDILPSVAATIIGAYIVNHYIVAKPAAPATAAVSTADPAATADGKPAEKAADIGNQPEAGVKAKGMSERTLLERSASEKAAVVEKPQDKSQDKTADVKPADAPAETASLPADSRRHQVAPREKTAVRVVLPSPVQAVAPAAVTSVTPPVPTVEAAVTPAAVAPEERRDANDLARAAIERLRNDNAQRTPEVARATQEAPRVMAPAMRPLPPPIMVSTPPSEAIDPVASQPKPPYATDAKADNPNRPTPPADIPVSRPPLDLRAEAMMPAPASKEHTTVAEDMLSAAKSVFHAVLPK